jgi:integration host factor subunit beta
MTKSELIATVVARRGISMAEARVLVETVLDKITSALAESDRVELRGFGSFSVKVRQARVGRNPKTGTEVDVVGKKVPFFKAGKELKARVDG